MRNRTTTWKMLPAAALCLALAMPVLSAGTSVQAATTTTATTGTTTAVTTTVTNPIMLGYYVKYYSTDKTSYNSLSNYTASYINQISTVTFGVTAAGAITGTAPADGLTLAAANKDKAFATIQNIGTGSFDSALAHSILTNASARSALIENILKLVRSNGYAGANLDFEDMPAADRPLYSSLVADLAATLHSNGYLLYVSVPAKTSDLPNSAWSGTFDYAALGQAADMIQLMSYDQNGPWGAPGPVAGLPWVESVIKYATSQIPASKLLIGLPAYGYDWNTTAGTGKAVTWKQTPGLLNTTGAAVQWDATQQSPWFTYTAAADGSKHTVWYENTASIQAKSALVKKYGLAGVSMWRMGFEDASFWNAAQAGMK